ncbi:unnamed protein product [Paramecium pentaurelia]|uniref:MORN motif protein n=1 Tax=Paramecium pentaurelia TaxID=43138 RepID=A0A8S1SFY3_9CILI|nr:unnamed protein product [Paramecium pentaurelia]
MNNSVIIQLEFQNGIYQGQTVQNKYKQGLGVYLWEDGCAYYGEWKSDEIDGLGIFFIPPKTQIIGHFKKAQINGNCILSTCRGTYYGQWIKGQPVDFITAKLQNLEMNIYFQNGKPIKNERKQIPKFEIPILKNKINDQNAIQQLELENGIFYGITSKNQLNQMIPNGLGIFISFDRLLLCSGQFKDGFLHGIGRLQNQTGDTYTGYFENGEYNGRGIYLSKKDGFKWKKGIWKVGDLIEVHQNGVLKDISSLKEIMFPYSDHKNPIQVQQPINVNEIKNFEEQIINYVQKSAYSSTNTSPDIGKKQTKLTRNYFSNSPKTSYEKISEILFGTKIQEEKQQTQKLKQIQQKKNNQLIKYYKDQCQQIEDSSKIQHFTNQSKEPQISHVKMKTHFIETSNMKEDIKRQLNHNFKYPNQEIKYLQILQQDQKVESQIKTSTNLKSERNNRVKTDLQLKQQLYHKQDKNKQNFNIQEPLLIFQQQKTQDSPKISQNQLISKTERNNNNQQLSAVKKNSLKKQINNNQQNNQCLDNFISIKDDNLEIDKLTSRDKQQSSIQRKSSQGKKQNHPKNESSKKKKDPKIQSQESEMSLRKKQDLEQIKKLSFSQQDFASNIDTFKCTDINQYQQNNFVKDYKPIVNDKHEVDQNQIMLIQRQQQYLEQIIDQQKQQLENLKKEQQLLDKEYQNIDVKSKLVTITNGSIDSLDSNPQYSESFNQDFIKSVKDIMRYELKRKQGDSIKDSPQFEQSKITNNQQSLFSNDIQSFENINQHDKITNIIKIQHEENTQQKVDFHQQSKKEVVSQRDLDDLLQDNSQIKQSRQIRRTKSSKCSIIKNLQDDQKIQNNQSLSNHSFHQSQEQPSKNFEKDYMDFNKSGMYQDNNQNKIKKQNQEILIQENEINQNQSIHKKSLSLIQLQDLQNLGFKNPVIKQQYDSKTKKSKIKESEKQQSINSLKQIASQSQHSSCIQNNQQNKYIQYQIHQKNQNVQVSISQEGKNTQQDIEDIKQQLESQNQILISLQNQILQSQSIKFTESKIQNVVSHTKSKSDLINFITDPCNSPIKKVIITKGQFPAFSIIKPITPIRL